MERAHARSVVAALLGVLLGSLLAGSTDPAALALGVAVMLLATVARPSMTTTAGWAGPARSDGFGTRHRAWSLVPLPLQDPGLPGRPQPRAPGCDAPGATA